jgi:hypothetical protein
MNDVDDKNIVQSSEILRVKRFIQTNRGNSGKLTVGKLNMCKE